MNRAAMKAIWTITCDSKANYYGPATYRSLEDGFIYNDYPEGWMIIAYNEYGNEYALPHTFADEARAKRMLERIEARLVAGGDLNLEHWHFIRVQYGSQAYIDDEPAICARERSDALDHEAFGHYMPTR